MKLVILRDKWLRGNSQLSKLLDPNNGKMCCLGFYGLACGYTAQEIEDFPHPSDVAGLQFLAHKRSSLWPEWGVQKNTKTVHVDIGEWEERTEFTECDDFDKLMLVNDEEDISEAEREMKIAEIFGRHGVLVEFV